MPKIGRPRDDSGYNEALKARARFHMTPERHLNDLPASDPLARAVKRYGQPLVDDNITDGSELMIRAVAVDGPLTKGYEEYPLVDYCAKESATVHGSGPHTEYEYVGDYKRTIKPFNHRDVSSTAHIIAVKVNDYTDEGRKETHRITATLDSILQRLKVSPHHTSVIKVRKDGTDGDGQSQQVNEVLFLDKKTNKGVAILMVEGHMG